MLGFWTADNITSKRSNKRRKHITATRTMITSNSNYNYVSGNQTDDDGPTYQTVYAVQLVPDLPCLLLTTN